MGSRFRALFRSPEHLIAGNRVFSPILHRLGLIRARASPATTSALPPSRAFEKAGAGWLASDEEKPVAALWGVPPLKRGSVTGCLREYRVAYARGPQHWAEQQRMLDEWPRLSIVAWGMSAPPEVREYAARRGIRISRLADGFIGQIQQHGNAVPLSIILDHLGIHYDASQPSDLEVLLNQHDFHGHPEIVRLALRCIEEIRLHGLTKRHASATEKAELLYGPKIRPRILVMGHVEERESIRHSCSTVRTNAELVSLAAKENPDAQILFSPHPDIVAKQNKATTPDNFSPLAEVLSVPLSLKDALHEVDRVYTASSLAGFEALIHGVPVTTLGAPFYSGWGLTDDRHITGRRNRKLSLEEIFAGAYLLYPRYIHPKTQEITDLPAALELLKDYRLATARQLGPEAALKRSKVFNLGTRNKVDLRAVVESTGKAIVIVADNLGALTEAKALAAAGKNVTFLCTDDVMPNSQEATLSQQESRNLSISSIRKLYTTPLSSIEVRSADLARAFSVELSAALAKVLSGHICQKVVEELAGGLKGALLNDALKFHAARSCLDDFDAVLLLFREKDKNVDVVESFLYHADREGKRHRIYCSAAIEVDQLDRLRTDEDAAIAPSDTDQLAAEFADLWQSLQDQALGRCSAIGAHISVCGHIYKDHYGYAPASWKLIEVLVGESNYPVMFHSSDFPRAASQEDAKEVFLERNLSDRCVVYDGSLRRYKERYGKSVFDKSWIFSRGVFGLFLENASGKLPHRLIRIFRPRLLRYMDTLYLHVIFAAESGLHMKECKLVATSMDGSTISRIMCALARDKGIPTIGIQPQIMSVSPRYLASAVDRMGVIDSSQADVYRELGAAPETLEVVGSVNYISRLQKLDAIAAELGSLPDRRSVFFAMQHSNARQMIETALALKAIAELHGLTVTVKPHPNQEVAVLHEVKRIFSGSPAFSVLSSDSDTYAAIPRCATIVGLSSNVLLESALNGRPVVVAAFDELHPSIDFSLLGMALKAPDAATLEQYILDIISDGPHSRRLAAGREEYVRRNPQFSRPYTYDRIESFIASALPKEAGARAVPGEGVLS